MGKDIIALMLQEYERFTRAERKIADYVLEHQEETQYISITDLSARCGVAVSTVRRCPPGRSSAAREARSRRRIPPPPSWARCSTPSRTS